MSSPASPPLLEFLSRSARKGASADEVADFVVRAWQGIQDALAPVIGQRGVTALYKRSVHLACGKHAAFKKLLAAGASDEVDLVALKAVLAQEQPPQAAVAGAEFLLSFHALVVSLIGPALTAQLLDGVWTSIFGGSPAQDPPS